MNPTTPVPRLSTQPQRSCHSEPVLTLAWQSVPPSPRPQARHPLFTCCLRRGTFVTSDKSTQKRRLKLRFKTSLARYALPQICFMLLAQSPFPRTVVRQKDCATTAFRCRFAAAAPCHGSSFPLYRRNLERISPFRHAAPVRACHCEPVLTLARHPFLSLPPAGYFCHQRQKYPKTPLETTFQDFLGALRPAANLLHASRAIAFPAYRCPSKGLCHHSFPLSLRCRCPVPR